MDKTTQKALQPSNFFLKARINEDGDMKGQKKMISNRIKYCYNPRIQSMKPPTQRLEGMSCSCSAFCVLSYF